MENTSLNYHPGKMFRQKTQHIMFISVCLFFGLLYYKYIRHDRYLYINIYYNNIRITQKVG